MENRILLIGDSPSQPSGWGVNSKRVAWALAKKYDVHLLGLQEYEQTKQIELTIQGIKRQITLHPNLPGTQGIPSGELDYGYKSVPYLLSTLRPDVIMPITDVNTYSYIPGILYPQSIKLNVVTPPSREMASEYALQQQLKGLIQKYKEHRTDCKFVIYGVQDSLPPMAKWATVYKSADKIIAYSKFAQQVFKDYYNIDCPVIYHGTDTDIFKPMDTRPEQFKDKFIVGDLNRNQVRKRPIELIKAFSLFAKDKDDVLLHLQKDWNDPAGWNLEYFTNLYGLQGKLIKPFPRGINQLIVRNVINAWDINMNCCFHPNTNILTKDGVKFIEDIDVNDYVLTKNGTFKKVINKYCYNHNGKILEIDLPYTPNIKLTHNHNVFRLKQRNAFRNSYWKDLCKRCKELVEVKASELERGDVMVIPRIKTQVKTVIPDKLMKLFGLYLAEGCISQRKSGKRKGRIEGIVFSINKNEIELTDFITKTMKSIYGLDAHVFDMTRNRRNIVFYSSKVGKQFKNMFSDSCYTKKIPSYFLEFENHKLECMLEGLFLGDGYIDYLPHNGKSTAYTLQTTSKTLAYVTWQILIKLGYISSICKQNRDGQALVYRVSINGKQNFNCVLKNIEHHSDRTQYIGWMDNDYFYIPIRAIKEIKYSGNVYDLEIDTNHNYCSPFLSHNSSGEGFGLCLRDSVNVITHNGVKSIKDISIGDLVMSNDGKYHMVVDTIERPIDNYYKVNIAKSPGVECSKEHPFLVTSQNRHQLKGTNGYDKQKLKLTWKNVTKLEKGNFVATPLPKHNDINVKIDLSKYDNNVVVDGNKLYYEHGYSPINKWPYSKISNTLGISKKIIENTYKHFKDGTEFQSDEQRKVAKFLVDNNISLPQQKIYNRYIELDDDLLYVLGWYVAEGSSSDSMIDFSLHINEIDIAKKIKHILEDKFRCHVQIRFKKHKKICIVTASGKILSKFFRKECGHLAQNKHIPYWLMQDRKKSLKIVKSIIDGDGHDEKSSRTLSLCTVSKVLAWQVWETLLANKIISSVLHRINNSSFGRDNSTIYNVSVTGESYFNYLNKKPTKRTGLHCIIKDGYLLSPIKSVKNINKNTMVYDIQVDGTHDFIGNGILLHNTIIDAGACGKPTIATDYTAMSELIKSGTSVRGQLVDYTLYWRQLQGAAGEQAIPDVKQMADALQRYYDNRKLMQNHGNNMRRWVLKNCNMKTLQDRWIEEMDDIL